MKNEIMKKTTVWIIFLSKWMLVSSITTSDSPVQEGSKSNKEFAPAVAPVANVSTPVGRDATLQCFVSIPKSINNIDDIKIAWIKVKTKDILTMDERMITRNTRISVIQREGNLWQLTIKNVKQIDQGGYMCQMNTDPMISSTGYLKITEPPSFMNNCTNDVTVREGENAQFICSAYGNPVPRITWKREKADDRPILAKNGRKGGSSQRKADGSKLKFTNVRREDGGAYLCMASNGIPPTVSRRFELVVEYPPEVHINVQVLRVPLGERVSINCTVRSSPVSTILWKRNQEVLFSGGNHQIHEKNSGIVSKSRLEILELDHSDNYATYSCEADNNVGSSMDTVDIRVLERTSYNSYETEVGPRMEVWNIDEKKQSTSSTLMKPTKSTKKQQNTYHHSSIYDTSSFKDENDVFKGKRKPYNIMHNSAVSVYSTITVLYQILMLVSGHVIPTLLVCQF